MTAIWTGLREGELLGLMWSDIDWENGWLHVERALKKPRDGKPVFGPPKTAESQRDMPLSPAVLAILKEHKSEQQVLQRLEAGHHWQDHNLLFTNRQGGPLNPSNLRNRYWYPLLDQAGLRRIHIHDCRHTFGTLLMTDLGADVKTVQELMGHTDGRTTLNIYGHGRTHTKKAAVSRMDAYLTADPEGTLSE